MAADKRILFISQEIAPFLSNGEMSELGRSLPQGMPSKEYEVRTFMPKFGSVNERRNQLHEVIRLSGLNICINDNDHPLIIKVASMQPSRIQVYFIDSDDYFQRDGADSDDVGSNRADNHERAIFFARGTIETVRKLRWEPGIIHVTGLMSSLAPVYMRHVYAGDPSFANAKIVYMVGDQPASDNEYVSLLNLLREDGVDEEFLAAFEGLKPDATLFHKLAIAASDAVVFHTENPDPELVRFAEQRGCIIALRDEVEGDPKKFIGFYDKISQ